MNSFKLHLNPSFTIGAVDPRVFGGFLEHIGRAVYEGVYEPESVHADHDGCRRDVLEAMGRLKYTAMRYPGGNFVSGYNWMDGVGPKERRPTVTDLAWQSLETNQFGTDEFGRLCQRMDWTPMMTVNLGTGTPVEARNWLEYCNGRPGTTWADMRVENGSPEPHDIKLWCLGNEMDGPWQIGHCPAENYAVLAQQAARMMKMCDPGVELVLCGSCAPEMKTYMEWDRTVLEHCHADVDFISLHRYVGNDADDTEQYLAVTNSIDQQIEEMDAVCRFIQAKNRSKNRVLLSFDEWNVWYKDRGGDGRGQHAPHLLEEVYNLEDALVVAGFLNSFIRHADVVKVANIAQIVNVIAPILTRGDDLLLQSSFYVLEMFTKRRTGASLRLAVEGATYDGKKYGEASLLDTSAILNRDQLNLFVTNRSVTQPAEVTVGGAGLSISSLVDGEILTGDDPKASNSFERKDAVVSRTFDDVVCKDGVATIKLPPLSVFAGTFALSM
jgi:alpha-N-arabinofuranosidase